MTYKMCLDHINKLESILSNEPKEIETHSLLERAHQAMEGLAEAFTPTVVEFGIIPRHLTDLQTRLVKLESELRAHYFDLEPKDSYYEETISNFYMHFNDVLGIIDSAMGTKGIDYDEPHVLTPKGLMPLRE